MRTVENDLFERPEKRRRAKNKSSEASIHMRVCQFILENYPDVLFWTDLSGLMLSVGQAVQIKKLRVGNGVPDLFLPEPRKYLGLFLELKKEGTKLTKMDGDYVNDRIHEQAVMIQKLKDRGYAAFFAIGYQDAINKIDRYLKFML